VNYFSRPSDTLLGILAGLQQMISADERASSYLAMSQCAHAGHLLAEYCPGLTRLRRQREQQPCQIVARLAEEEDYPAAFAELPNSRIGSVKPFEVPSVSSTGDLFIPPNPFLISSRSACLPSSRRVVARAILRHEIQQAA
jgi:hypothetical protein